MTRFDRLNPSLLGGALPLLALLQAPAALADDGQVDDRSLSHLGWHDRSPAVPVRGESFTVRFQALAGDLTSAAVRRYSSGAPAVSFPASLVDQRGPYAIWEAQVTGLNADRLEYDIEVVDGADTDYIGLDGHGESSPTGGPFALDFTTWEHAPRGATPTSDGVVFKVWAPTAPTCNVRGSFNGWSLSDPMLRVGADFVRLVPGASTGDEYKYYFGATQTWKSDPNARRMVGLENSVVFDPDYFPWSVEHFTPPPFEAQVHYQLHVGSFAGRNDPYGPAANPSRFIDIVGRIPHLVELGVNVVYLNPVDEWPGSFSGGYNPISYTAIESSYGTPDELKFLVDTLHANGIAVILDVVPNHVDFSSNFLYGFQGPLDPLDNIYFDTPPYDTPWGPQLDLNQADVRAYVFDALVQKLEEYRFDGLRVDSVATMTGGPQGFFGYDLLREFNRLAERRWADKLIVAEEYSDAASVTRDVAQGGLGFDAQYHNAWKLSIRDALLGSPASGANTSAVASAMTRTLEPAGARVFNYFELHDEVWSLSGGERAVRTLDPTFPHDDPLATGRSKLGHGLNLLSKGVPAFVMGAEWIEDDDWQNQKIDWTHALLYGGVVDFFSELITLRTSEPALFADAAASTIHLNEGQDVFAVERSLAGGDSWMVVANIGPSPWTEAVPYRFGLPRGGTWRVRINSDSTWYRGQGTGAVGFFDAEPIPYDGQPWSVALALPAEGLLLLEHDPGLLDASPAELSLAAGGAVSLALDVTPEHAGDLHLMLGSATGSSPSLPLAPGVALPLVPDGYFQLSLGAPNQPPFDGTFGVIDAKGRASGAVQLPPGLPAALAGSTLWHAALVIDSATLALERASAAAGVLLTP
jgi:1,4-alpha-glucan branching enzyme